MKFSVLVPVYNVKAYLAACLDSILNQEYDDMELIIVNDGSTDGSEVICRDYEKRFSSRLRLLEQQNRGLLLARRAAIDAAQGDYLVFVDSDDTLRSDALTVIDQLLSRNEADVLLFQASRSPLFDNPYFDHRGLYDCLTLDGHIPSEVMRSELAKTHNVNSMWAKAIRRECIDQYADYEKYEGLQYGEDLLQMCPIFNRARSFAISSEILYYYRDNDSSISHHVRYARLKDISKARSCLATYVEKWDSSLLPYVYANDCVELFSYCLLCVNRLSQGDAEREIRRAMGLDHFICSFAKANLDVIPFWKRIGIKWLFQDSVERFIALYAFIFHYLAFVMPGKASRYI